MMVRQNRAKVEAEQGTAEYAHEHDAPGGDGTHCLALPRRTLQLSALRPPTAVPAHRSIEMTTASPPRLRIRPVRFAFRCKITPASFCIHRSPALVEPIAKP